MPLVRSATCPGVGLDGDWPDRIGTVELDALDKVRGNGCSVCPEYTATIFSVDA
jgi:hypothetical protein